MDQPKVDRRSLKNGMQTHGRRDVVPERFPHPTRRRRIEKIELQVYASNRPARALYRKFGFAQEGRRIRARKLDGKYDDVILMGKLL